METHPLVPASPPPAGPLTPAAPAHQQLLAAFLSGRRPRTLRAYARDLADFAGWSGVCSSAEAVRLLLAAGPGGANAAALAWRNDLAARGLAPATIARRLAALRSLCRLARVLGITTWTLEVEAPRVETLRDTRGPGKDGFPRLPVQLEVRADRKGLRDRAILHLLFDLALRRAEVCSLDLCHLDLQAGAVEVLGKGRSRRERLSLPGPTSQALAAWVQVRG